MASPSPSYNNRRSLHQPTNFKWLFGKRDWWDKNGVQKGQQRQTKNKQQLRTYLGVSSQSWSPSQDNLSGNNMWIRSVVANIFLGTPRETAPKLKTKVIATQWLPSQHPQCIQSCSEPEQVCSWEHCWSRSAWSRVIGAAFANALCLSVPRRSHLKALPSPHPSGPPPRTATLEPWCPEKVGGLALRLTMGVRKGQALMMWPIGCHLGHPRWRRFCQS